MILAVVLGLLLGFVGSVPVAGPIAALVVTRGIQGRFRAGAYVALGGALLEAAYACLAFWGFSTFLARYPVVVPISRAAAAVILAALGLSFLFGKQQQPDGELPPTDSAWASFAVGASICAFNPTLIATWTAVVTTLHASGWVDMQGAQAVPFGAGVLGGIAGWFLLLLGIIRRYRGRFSPSTLTRTVRVIGALLLLLAGWFALRFVQYLTA